MKNESSVIHLADYIHKKESVKTLLPNQEGPVLATPESYLVRRVIAFLVDLLIISVIRSGIHVAYAVFMNEIMTPISLAKRTELALGSSGLHFTTFILVYTTYFLYTTFILDGKTVGKLTMKLRVINESYIHNRDEDNFDLDLKASSKRALGYLLCFLSFGVFFIFNFSSEDKRGLPDYLSGSRTVSDEWLAKYQEFKDVEHEHVFIDIQDLNQAA